MGIDLKKALENISTKIASSASSASPEELAYLGTAIDRIGGRSTVYEIVEVADLVKGEINTLSINLQDNMSLNFTNKITESTNQVNATLANMVNSAVATEVTTIQNIQNKQNSSELYITEHKNEAESYITDVKDNAELYINSVKTAAEQALDDKKQVTITSTNLVIDTAVANATQTVTEKSVELQNAANELSSAAALANTQAVNSSLFTMMFLSSMQ